jgi:uncharacterized protein (DUF2235 family)
MDETPPDSATSRNLIICCDGTNNQFGSNNTNVIRLIQALDRDPVRQRLFYDAGVGTLPEPASWGWLKKVWFELSDLAFAVGLPDRVASAYGYLMDMWEPGDRVFMFGFSRGAYTVRVLAALLHELGLLPRGGANLVPYAYRLFKAIRKQPKGKPGSYWDVCDQFRWTFARPVTTGDNDRRFPVHFVGVWDTVSSVGWVWNPTTFPYTHKNPGISIFSKQRQDKISKKAGSRASIATSEAVIRIAECGEQPSSGWYAKLKIRDSSSTRIVLVS